MMTENKFRWYHRLMVPFALQAALVICSILVIGAQVVIYEGLEDDIVVFNGECSAELGNFVITGEENTRQLNRATMMCGDDKRGLGALEMPYLYERLHNNHTPVIVCEKTVSEYLHNVHWSCEMDPEEETA